VGGEDGAGFIKLILVGITTVGIIMQLSRGRAKGKSFAEALVDDEMDAIGEIVASTKSKAASLMRREEE